MLKSSRCPWRPGDLAQRKGRIERQGNQNPLVHVYRYVTEGTFDAYLWPVSYTHLLKASDPMKWVGLMNTCKAQAEEILMAELINS